MEVSYRAAHRNDMQLLFDWTNDPEVRSNSYHSGPISLSEHNDWFLRKIADKHTLFFIAEINNHPAGVVRFDIREDHAIVGISIDKNFRGRGLAAILLTDCAQSYFKRESKAILAYIKNSNEASIHSFQKAGFSFLRKENVNGFESQVFIKEKDNE